MGSQIDEKGDSHPSAVIFKTHHKSSYPAISPQKSENSHKGKTVLVTGGSAGIGYSIAGSFALSGAARVIILGRRKDAIERAAEAIKNTPAVGSEIIPYTCDVASFSDVDTVLADLDKRNINIDILVLNAAYMAHPAPTFAENGGAVSEIVKSFDVNVKGNMYLTHKFLSQRLLSTHQRVILNVSSAVAHKQFPNQNVYGSSKAASAVIFQGLSDELKGQVQMINIHPGAIFSEAAAAFGLTKERGIPVPGGIVSWDDDDLPGHFCTWAASAAAGFLHGRFVWANWDVDELEGLKGRLESDPDFLRLGLIGWASENLGSLFGGNKG